MLSHQTPLRRASGKFRTDDNLLVTRISQRPLKPLLANGIGENQDRREGQAYLFQRPRPLSQQTPFVEPPAVSDDRRLLVF
ncbi:hypothetical protein HanIR_Chr08g0374061 [Helianthus annuus]|nr:hypothetical protein HanIR_Chr08g0374061 [Helianthus annuus]